MQIIKTKKITWVDIKNPSDKDIKWLKDKFGLHPLVLKELLPQLDYPKMENFGNYFFAVFFYPFFDRKTFQTIPLELDIIFSKNYIITVHPKDIVPLKAIFDQCNLYEDKLKEYTKDGVGQLLYIIIKEILNACFPKLGHIKQNIDKIERSIYQQEYKESVEQISLVKRDIIGFQRIIESEKTVIEDLVKELKGYFNKNLSPYFGNLLGLYRQIESILSTNHKTLAALEQTNESLLNTWTNEVIRLLTIFSVIVFPLTLMAGIFGMNTRYLPFVGLKGDFWIILGIMFVSSLIMLLYFKKRNWI